MVRATNRYAGREDRETPTIFFEFHGSEGAVAECVESVRELAKQNGGEELHWASDPEARDSLWRARHDAYWAARALRPGTRAWSTDVCVPISRLAESILATRKDIDAAHLLAPVVGHVGDGNFHLIMLIHPDDEEEMARAQGVYSRMVQRALDFGGTCTGEHGVGYGKIAWVEKEHGDAVGVMRTIKQALDPRGILNPGKIFRPA
jgi:D-lactate dehydrogenase (cytochrome)